MQTQVPGRLIGVSLGPGDPGNITRAGWRALTSAARWSYPVKREGEESYALDILRRTDLPVPPDALPLVFPMTHDREILGRAWARAAVQVAETLATGRDVLFLVEGDASTYATFGYLGQAVRALDAGYQVEVLPGVSSYCAAAAKTGQPLVEGDDTLAVLPANYGVAVIEHLLEDFDTLVLLKVKPQLDAVIDLLRRRNLLGEARFVEKVGSPEERVITDVASLEGQSVAYLSLMIIHNPGRVKGEIARGCRAGKG